MQFIKICFKRKELSETKEEYRTALYSIGDAVIATDRHSIVKQMNSVAEELTGWKESEAKGKNLMKYLELLMRKLNNKFKTL